MRLADVAENAGLSIAAGGSVTAVGGSLLAVGLTQTASLQCGWVVGGLALVVLGAAWVLASFVLAIWASSKNRALYEGLGEALFQGEGLRRVNLDGRTPDPDSVEDWTNRTRALIDAGLGQSGVSYFDAYAGGTQPPPEVQEWEQPLSYRLTRLKELMERPVRARLDFPTGRRWFEGFEARPG